MCASLSTERIQPKRMFCCQVQSRDPRHGLQVAAAAPGCTQSSLLIIMAADKKTLHVITPFISISALNARRVCSTGVFDV